MSIATEIHPGCLTFWDVSWEFYEQFLKEYDGQYIRHTYDDGAFEIMAPISWEHEGSKRLLTWLVQALVEELDIPIVCLGSMTLKNQQKARGIEPNECFYIAHEAGMRARTEFDSDSDPPPDLAIEIDWTNSRVPRMPVYAKLGVPEVWRWADQHLTVIVLGDTGESVESDQSPAFPSLPLSEFQHFVIRDPAVNETAWIRQFRQWVRTRLIK